MKNLFIGLLLLLTCLFSFTADAGRSCKEHSATPLVLTTAWQDAGSTINISGTKSMDVVFKINVNASSEFQFRVLRKQALADADWAELTINSEDVTTPGAEKVVGYPFLWEAGYDTADWVATVPLAFRNVTGFIKLQFQLGTAGGTGAIDYVNFCVASK